MPRKHVTPWEEAWQARGAASRASTRTAAVKDLISASAHNNFSHGLNGQGLLLLSQSVGQLTFGSTATMPTSCLPSA